MKSRTKILAAITIATATVAAVIALRQPAPRNPLTFYEGECIQFPEGCYTVPPGVMVTKERTDLRGDETPILGLCIDYPNGVPMNMPCFLQYPENGVIYRLHLEPAER